MSAMVNIFNQSKRIILQAVRRKESVIFTKIKLFHYRSCNLTWDFYKQPNVLVAPNLQIGFRNKHSKKKSESVEEQDDEDETWENETFDRDSRIVKLKVNSLRTDLVLKAGLAIARNKVETIFYESKIRVNGRKISKKSSQVHIGDELDIIRGISPMNPDFLLVSRVEILSARDNSDGTITVQMRRTKSLTIENYEDDNKFT